MIKSSNYLKAFAGFGFCLILLQVSSSWGEELSASVVNIYSKGVYLCPGTLVKDNFVITSVECLEWQKDASVLTVAGHVVGNKATPAEESSVIDIFIHQDYNTGTRYMGVAVLKLAKSIVGPNNKPAKLCNKNAIKSGEMVTLYVSKIKDDPTRHEPSGLDLLKLNVIVSDRNACVRAYGRKFPDTMFCAADDDKVYYLLGMIGLAAIDGEVCGIPHSGPLCINKKFPAFFTSLANTEVIKFITESLDK